MFYCCAGCVLLIGIIISIIHNSPPYLETECVLFSINCPELHSQTISKPPKQSKLNFDLVGKSLTHWVETGEEIASQVSIRIKGQEVYNVYASDAVKTNGHFDEKSLCSIFSNTKTFTALFMAIAVDNGWIDSYDDRVTKYWPRFPTNNGKHNIRISDVLRHEAGLCVYSRYRVVYDLWNINIATYNIIKNAIEDESIRYFSDHQRCYHTISRGHILNEIFHLVEPKRRYMAEYYEQEILPNMIQSDAAFGLTFRGLRYVGSFGRPRLYNLNRSFDIESPSFWWELYHVKFPQYIVKQPVLEDSAIHRKICRYLENPSACPKQSLSVNMTIFGMALNNVWEMYEANDYRPKQMSQYNRDMVIEHMSSMGLANAHSMTKLYEFMLKQLISKQTQELVFSDGDTKFDVALDTNTTFTLGGFGQHFWAGVEWYGWSGWGGSTMLYAPKYDAFVAYTVTGFNRKNYGALMDPRKFVIVNLIARQLEKLGN